MNTLLLRTLELKKSPSVQTFAQYREAESQNCRHTSVTSEGELLEHQTLELRVHPPNVSMVRRQAACVVGSPVNDQTCKTDTKYQETAAGTWCTVVKLTSQLQLQT